MSVFRSTIPFDENLLSNSVDFLTASDRYLERHVTVDGVTYDAALVMEFGVPVERTLKFLGHDIVTEQGHVVRGRLNAVCSAHFDIASGSWVQDVLMRGFSISALDYYLSQLSDDMADDWQVMAAILDGNDRIFLSDGDDIARGMAGNDRIMAGDGQDRIRGGVGNDTIVGGRGDDVLSGGADADIFVFGSRAGADVIVDFKPGLDQIRFRSGPTALEDLVITQVGADAELDFGAGSILLHDVAAADLQASDFLFV